jgi:putative tricarboxylic transport membrane protein
MKNNDQGSSVIWFLMGAGISFYSVKYGLGGFHNPGPGFVPFLAGAALAGLSLVIFFQQFSKRGKERVKDLWLKTNWRTMVMVMAALVVYTALFTFLGFLLDTFLLIAFLLRVMEPMSWKKVLAGSLGTALASYAIFQLWLQAQLPSGILGF